jgi:phage regulator Rha-like protein
MGKRKSPDLLPVKIVEGERRVDSRNIADELGIDNRTIVKLVQRYENDFSEFGVLAFQMLKPKKKTKGGRPETYIYLNKEHANLALAYSKNTYKARQLKKKLVRTFSFYERAYIRQVRQQGIAAWQQARAEGKIIRQQETDTIQALAAYAAGQGSKNSNRYFVAISKMVNTALFVNLSFLLKALPEKTNLRNLMDCLQLKQVEMADFIVARALKEGMEKEVHYKDVYKMAKARVETFVAVAGKTRLLPGATQATTPLALTG